MSKNTTAENSFHLVGNEVVPESEYKARIQRERNKKDSIRTTFRIRETLIKKFKDVGGGYKLIDLFEDLSDLILSKEAVGILFRNDMIDTLTEVEITAARKSYLLSKQASSSITKISKKFDLSRDVVVNYLIVVWIDAQEMQQKKQHKAYKKVQDYLYEAISALEKMEETFREAVPSNDPYFTDIGYSLQTLYNAEIAVEQYFETGEYQNDHSL